MHCIYMAKKDDKKQSYKLLKFKTQTNEMTYCLFKKGFAFKTILAIDSGKMYIRNLFQVRQLQENIECLNLPGTVWIV